MVSNKPQPNSSLGMISKMRVRFITTFAVLCFASVGYGEEHNVIRGTNVIMDISGVYRWSGFANAYFSLDHAGTMVIVYSRLTINDAIKKYKLRILRTQLDVLEKEWFERDGKYYLICYNKMTGERNKSYVLFIGDKDGTYIFVSRLLLVVEPNAGEKILDVYRSSRLADQKVDLRKALFYEINPPDGYTLMESEGNRTLYSIERGRDQEPDTVYFVGYIFDKRRKLEAYLSHYGSSSNKVIFNGAVGFLARNYKSWKKVSFDSATDKYHVQYAILNAKYVLYVDATIGAASYKANEHEMDDLVKGIKIKYPFGEQD